MLKAVDLFAGAGGSSTGATQAGVRIVAAVNHWPIAVTTHSLNHPAAKHYCQDAGLLDPSQLPSHNMLLASPECKGHTRARGKDRKHHDKSRATAWCVINVAEVTHPKAIIVENVPEFSQWQLYPEWRSSLEKLGYRLTENVLDAANFRVPQNRVRLLIVAMRGKQARPIDPVRPVLVPIRNCIDLNAGRWSPVKGHAANTVERCQHGWKEFGDAFLICYYGNTKTARSLDRPIGTVTTHDRWAIVRGDEMRMLSPDEYKQAMGFPADYQLAGTHSEKVCQLGNAVVPGVMKAVCRSIMEVA